MRRLMALVLALALLCAGCRLREDRSAEGVRLYFLTSQGGKDGQAVGSEVREEDEPTAEALLRLLLAGPESEELTSPFPRGTVLRGCRVEEGVALVDLSEAYGGLSGVDLSLADACVVLTLCQLDEVEQVYLTVEGERRPFRDQVLSPADLLLDNGGEAPGGRREVRLAFLSGDALAWEERSLTLSLGDDIRIAALQALLKGPESSGLEPVCPEGTRLLSLEEDREGYLVDLSGAFLEGESDPRRLYAIVDTLGALDGEARVRFSVEGQRLEVFGELDLTEPLAFEAEEKE